MAFRGDDDYEYIDDEDFYGDDEEDDDEDEELGGDWRSRLGNRSSNLPGPGRDRSSSVLGGSGARGSVYGKSDSSKLPGGRSGSSAGRSNYSSSGSRDSIRDRVNRPSGDTGKLRGSSSSSSSSGGDWRSRIGNKDRKSVV